MFRCLNYKISFDVIQLVKFLGYANRTIFIQISVETLCHAELCRSITFP